MKRTNTADAEMIREIKELKANGVKTFVCSYWVEKEDGTEKHYKPVLKQTAQGISSFANQMYKKYGDAVTVVVSYLDREYKFHDYCTYHA